MMTALEQINTAPKPDVESIFLDCCGSQKWAMRMTDSRPFESEDELTKRATTIWNDLEADDWIEAFAAHPRIGQTKQSQPARSSNWSAGEQAGMDSADDGIRTELAEANEKYFDKFGFIFIVCATGKSAGEMLDLCKARLDNDLDTEIAIAAAEQQKITDIRLKKFLSS